MNSLTPAKTAVIRAILDNAGIEYSHDGINDWRPYESPAYTEYSIRAVLSDGNNNPHFRVAAPST
jgi:Helicase-associated putative binding domain, C-terminal